MDSVERKIAVVGSGVIGLTAALRLLQSGFKVDIFYRDAFAETASAAAGAYWWPHKAYPPERVEGWSKRTLDYYRELRQNPDSGIRFETHYRFCLDPDECAYVRHLVDDCKAIDGSAYGVDSVEAYKVVVPVINVPVYMPFLQAQVQQAGAGFFQRELNDLAELEGDYDCIVNCSGLGARTLVDDDSVFPIRGQVVLVSSDGLAAESYRIYAKDGPLTLVLPRGQDCVLGGTGQENDWDLDPREADTRAILERCAELVPAVANAQVRDVTVGLRPGRLEIRLELETSVSGPPVIHNYGHGGGGYTVAWGCAEEVAKLVKNSCSG
ncbi:MAG: FAD-dependent oxidoreductase [Opitutales bacterium]|nr:FAD-dependent oxidoreductase [Opitutales bacterium]